MKENKSFKVKVNGVVKSNFKDADTGKRTINAYITPKAMEVLETQITSLGMQWYGDKYPIKEEVDTGKPFITSRSSFDIPVKNLPKGCDIEDIGKGSKVVLYCNIKEGEYGRKPYVSAYLLGVDVVDFVEKEFYDVFSEDGFAETESGDDVFADLPDTDKTAVQTA